MMTLQADALRLLELHRQVSKALIECDAEELRRALLAWIELRESVKMQLLEASVISVGDAKASEILRKIADGDDLQPDEIIRQLLRRDDELTAEEFDDLDIERLGSELFYSWYSHHEYVKALAELRPLILRSDASQSVHRLIREAKDCYAFQQYDAVFALCRMSIEASIRNICVRRGLLPEPDEKVNLLEKYYWKELRDKVSIGSLNEKLENIYGRLCEVVHARRSATAGEARAMFRRTLSIIEELYGSHGF